MKLIFASIFSVLILIPIESTNAQIWKRIKNKTQQKVEDRVADKISDKLADAVMEKMSSKLEDSSNPYRGSTKISKPDNLPEEYRFDWQYQMKMTSNQSADEIMLDYRLSEEGDYFGYSTPHSEDVFTVIDSEQEAMVSYMEEDGNSFAMSYSYPTNLVNEEMSNYEEQDDIEVTELPDKEILGYTAKGYKIDTPDSEMIIYVTSETGVSFSGMTTMPNQGMPNYFSSNLDEMENTLMLYMKFESKSNSDHTMEMECVGLEKKKLTKVNSQYKFL
ncbi:MAG: hypothetical protein ABJH08_01415 [Balneola sp.]